MPSSFLNEKVVRKGLGSHSFLKRIEVFESIDSTNAYAKKLLTEGIEEPTLIVAEEQTRGRGRFGRTWRAERGKNLMFSLLVSPGVPPQYFGILPLLTALGAAKGIESLTKVNVATKWPNDLLIDDKKVCGILLETVSSRPDRIIIGIGVNVNQSKFSPDLHATSILREGTKPIDRLKLLVSILRHFEWLSGPVSADKIPAMLAEWQSRCSMLKRTVRVQIVNEILSGIARGIADDGALLLVVDGKDRKLHAGEVTILPS